jgi:hypothetical protein
MREQLLYLFRTHFFSIDYGAVLTACETKDEAVRCSEKDDEGNTFEYVFPFESLDDAVCEDGTGVSLKDAQGDECVVAFFSPAPVKIN